jgi:hypothetical protein
MSSSDEFALTPVLPLLLARSLMTSTTSRFQRGWPAGALTIALGINVAWIGLLGFGLFKLFEPVFLWCIS